jgi:hypothetical protein
MSGLRIPAVQRYQSYKFKLRPSRNQAISDPANRGLLPVCIQSSAGDSSTVSKAKGSWSLPHSISGWQSGAGTPQAFGWLMYRLVACSRRSKIWDRRTLAIEAAKRDSRFATLSDGRFYTPLNSFRRHEHALAAAQRSFSRKTKYSNNRRKEKARVQRIYVRIANARGDYCIRSHTRSAKTTRLCVEDLRVSAMSKSDGAAAKRRLNNS